MEIKIDKILCNPAQVNLVRTTLEKHGAYQSIGKVMPDAKVEFGEILLQDENKKTCMHFSLG